MAGVVVGGNFTSLGGRESPGAALFDPNTAAITPLSGLSGSVSALLCDQDTNTVYVGGSFKGANSTNAIAWVGTSGWTNLPFAGFNGPVTAISKASNGNIIFGGSFTGLGNGDSSTIGPVTPDQQAINIPGANISAASSSPTTGFSDPRNILCKTGGADGAGNTWLLRDNSAGSWRADFGFGFEPTKLRLYNTHQDGRGTRTWRYTAFPINGIMNFTYTDPATGANASCTSECPLSNDQGIKFQDFFFVNAVGMNSFQIDISDFYGSGGGLNGIELFQDDIFSYAVNAFNEPTCAGTVAAPGATSTGPWRTTASGESVGQYLSATVTGSERPTVTFFPDIKQSGNYSVNIYTPGCLQDNSCNVRGRVNVTGIMATSTAGARFDTEIFQTNNFDKFDQLYFGFIDAAKDGFRPSIILSPSAGQDIPNLSVVALRVGFNLVSATAGLNNIFEYDPSVATVSAAETANSTFNKAGTELPTGSDVTALTTSGETTFIAGNFSSTEFDNIFSIRGTEKASLSQGGLNGEVNAMFLTGTTLFVGGKFTGTKNGGTTGLGGIASYDTSSNTWSALGAGVKGNVKRIVPLQLNITIDRPESVITLTGDFDQILAFGSNTAISVDGFAVWVPSAKNWLQNLGTPTLFIDGELTAFVDVANGTLFAGSLSSASISANGVVGLTNGLSNLPINIKSAQPQSTSTLTKRIDGSQNVTGVVTGLFYENGGRNMTILGGHFTAAGTNGSDVNNLAFINGADSDAVSGVGSALQVDSTILALAVQGDTLWVGGVLKGTVSGSSVNGLVAWNLIDSTFSTQPPSLVGGNVHVITIKPEGDDIYVGGSFATAGSLSCPGVCVFNTKESQWDRPGNNLEGIANVMWWQSQNTLLVGGELSIGGRNTSLVLYDVASQNWTIAAGAEEIPGPVTAISAASSDGKLLWAAGTATNGTAFLMKFDGSAWSSVGDRLGSGTNIRGLQILSLSENHDSSDLVDAGKTLMITGSINIPGFGNASAVLFNGTAFQPFALTSSTSNSGGSISQFFSQKQNFFAAPGTYSYTGSSQTVC